jgi:hypothetical protein
MATPVGNGTKVEEAATAGTQDLDLGGVAAGDDSELRFAGGDEAATGAHPDGARSRLVASVVEREDADGRGAAEVHVSRAVHELVRDAQGRVGGELDGDVVAEGGPAGLVWNGGEVALGDVPVAQWRADAPARDPQQDEQRDRREPNAVWMPAPALVDGWLRDPCALGEVVPCVLQLADRARLTESPGLRPSY